MKNLTLCTIGGTPKWKEKFQQLILHLAKLGSQEARFFSRGHKTVSLSLGQFCIHSFLFFRPSHLLLGVGQGYLAFLSLSFICKRGNTIFSGLRKMALNKHSVNAVFYDVIKPKHHLSSIINKTLPKTYWCTSAVNPPGPAFCLLPLSDLMASAHLYMISLQA